jgi:fibulin 1/2
MRVADECASGASPCRGASQHCFNTRGGYKCHDLSCPTNYVREEGHERRCRRAPTATCQPGDAACLRQPVSISHNFIALISKLRVHGQGVNLFTMQSARYAGVTTRFSLVVKDVRAPKDVVAASADNFRLNTGDYSAVLSLVRPITGPQDIHLQLLMEMYRLGRFQASASANVYIYVTPYEF